MIQGCAGSGKTSVALHRIAYLLYHDRKNLKSSNILILSPNSVFSNYISHILPELGEENIQEMSFDLFAYRELLDTVNDCEDRYDQIERMMREPEKARGFCEKQSHAFLGEMEEFLLLLEDELMNFQDISFKGFLMKDREIIRLFYEKFLDIPLLSRMDAVIEYFIDEYETLYNAHLDEQEQEQLREKFYRMYETRDLYILYSRFLKEYRNERLPKLPREKRKVRFEDVYPLLYMKYRLTRRAENSRIKHLVIDEMQDYSKIQYLILRQIFPCKMTILGDRAQTIDENMQDVTRFLPDIFGKDIRKIVMNKSYRNTVEIADYAGKITGIQDIELFERHGRPVEEAVFTDMAKAAAKAVKNLRLSEDEYETAAVLVMTEEEARLAAAYMKEKLLEEGFDVQNRFSYIDKNSSAFIKGITVTTFYLAKGLEFDQVFTIYQENDNPLLSQAKYICATRALHELYMYQYTRR